jgi:hypothetical protein
MKMLIWGGAVLQRYDSGVRSTGALAPEVAL